MSVFDKLDRLKERATERAAKALAKQGTAVAKAAAKKGAEVAVAAAKEASKKLEGVLFGESDAGEREDGPAKKDSAASKAEKKRKEEEIGVRLRAADRRVKERAAEEKRQAQDREASRVRVEKEIDDDLAALKKKRGDKR